MVPKPFICNIFVEHLPLVIFVKELIKLVVIRSEFHVECQTCPEFYDDRVHKISAFLPVHARSYENFSEAMLAAQIGETSCNDETFQARSVR
jgi:hypothetical protein